MLAIALLLCCQSPVALASTTSDTDLTTDSQVPDEAWIRMAEGEPGGRLYLNRQAIGALIGDVTGDGVPDVPSDIDALCWFHQSPGQPDSIYEVLFSTITSMGSFEDGDLLRFVPGQGLIAEVPEAEFIAALQPSSGSFDIDAAAWRFPDEFWFSVTTDLLGTVIGDVQDGDILVYDRSTGTVWQAFDEADIQGYVDHAMGSPAAAIGDVLSLSFYPTTGEMVFTVQSDSTHDATVFGTGNSGRILTDWEESDWGFLGAAELDALCFLPDGLPQPPVLRTDLAVVAPQTPVRFYVNHGSSAGLVEGFLALTTGHGDRPGGVGFLFLDRNDRVLRRLVRGRHTHPQMLDASGTLTFDWVAPPLPPGRTRLNLYFQVFDHGGAGWSPPIVLGVE